MQNKIIALLDEILRFEELEKKSSKEQNILRNEIEDMEQKLEEVESKSILEKVMDEVIQSFEKTSQIFNDESQYLPTEHNFIDISQTQNETQTLEGKVMWKKVMFSHHSARRHNTRIRIKEFQENGGVGSQRTHDTCQ